MKITFFCSYNSYLKNILKVSLTPLSWQDHGFYPCVLFQMYPQSETRCTSPDLGSGEKGLEQIFYQK